jgi:hypothetical protein
LKDNSNWDFSALLTKRYLIPSVYKNNALYGAFLEESTFNNQNKILTFKNEDIYLKIDTNHNTNNLYILQPSIISSFYKQFIYLINFTFNNNGNYIL